MKIQSLIVLKRIIPDNNLIAPHWLANWQKLEGSGRDPREALDALLFKVQAQALAQPEPTTEQIAAVRSATTKAELAAALKAIDPQVLAQAGIV